MRKGIEKNNNRQTAVTHCIHTPTQLEPPMARMSLTTQAHRKPSCFVSHDETAHEEVDMYNIAKRKKLLYTHINLQ